ncbi:MAG: DUF1211 domain-containing protein [Pyrinomonadaceae bacterium]|nr:DUF1211 domain-containing protein [Phycisphaerales bacterium]
MIRRTLMQQTNQPKPTDFRNRGHEVSRIEGFSDAVFGFALTLLVVSLQVPETFDQMIDTMKDALAFGVCFVLLFHFWYKHYVFFRRYGLSDMPTILLNAALLFVLLMYVYPLKFMFSIVVAMMTGIGPKRVSSGMISNADVPTLFIVFGAGYAALYGIYALLHLHALRMSGKLGLSELERHDTRTGIYTNLACGSLGVISIILALTLSGAWLQVAGWCYGLTGFFAAAVGVSMGARRTRLERTSNASEATSTI